jgi:hypothetical protein
MIKLYTLIKFDLLDRVIPKEKMAANRSINQRAHPRIS